MLFLDNQLPSALLDAVHAAALVDTGGGGGFNGRNDTTPSDSSDHFDQSVWKALVSRYPLTNIWPLAILIAFTALTILSILLKLLWSLARAKLCFFRVYKLHYSTPTYTTPFGLDPPWDNNLQYGDKMRSLYIPAEGSVLLCSLSCCLATVVRAVSIEMKGRAVWLSQSDAIARNIEYTSLWLAIIFIIAGSICHIPLFTSKTSPSNFLAIPNDFLPILPKELSKPALHPLSVNALVFGVPIIICLLPNLSALSKTFRNLKTFENQLIQLSRAAGGLEDVISSMPLSHDGTSTASRDANLISVSIGVSGILGNWQLESFIRSCTGAALIAVLLFVEYIIYKRLSGASIYLEAVEQAALRESPAANHSFIIEKDYPDIIGLNEEKEDNLTHLPLQNSLNRTRSILSSSTRSGGRPSPLYPDEGPRRPQSVLSRSCIGHPNARPTSRSASHRSFSAMSMSSASSRLYVPELPDFSVTLPSPSLVKDDLASSMRGIGGDGPSPYSPALALFGDKLDRSVSGPRDRFTSNEDFSISSSRIQPLVRGTSQRSEASSLACSEKIFEPRQKRHTSLIPDQVTSSVQNGMKREDEVSSDYFALGRLPYDLDDEDQYEAQLEGLKFGAAVAHMLTPYGGIAEPAEKTTMPSEAPSTMVMEGDVTKQSQLSRLHTPGLGHEREVQTSKHRAPSAVSRRVSTHSRPQSRASSYSYGSQSSLGSSSIFSKSSKRTAASWRSKLFHEQRYQGPAALQLKTLKKSRIIETSVLGLFILVSSLLELVCGIAGRNVLESKSVQASVTFASMLLKILPILGGVILSALRSSAPAYGWQTRHIMVKLVDENETSTFDDGASYRSGMPF